MTGAKITIDHNFDDAARIFNDLLAFGQDPDEFMYEVGGRMADSTRLRFVDQAGPNGESWPQSIRARETGGRTLFQSGALEDGISHNLTADGVEWGSNQVYAAIHQFGGTITPKNGEYLKFKIGNRYVSAKRVDIPARPFLGISPEDELTIEELFADYTREIVQ